MPDLLVTVQDDTDVMVWLVDTVLMRDGRVDLYRHDEHVITLDESDYVNGLSVERFEGELQ